MHSGGKHVLEKPVKPETLLNAVADALKQASLKQKESMLIWIAFEVVGSIPVVFVQLSPCKLITYAGLT